MGKLLSWVFAATLICGLNVLTACSIEDNIGGGTQELTPAKIQKQWIHDYAEEGIDDEFGEPYNRVVEVYEFFKDNTGFYELYRFDVNELVNVKSLRGDNGDFTYSLSGNTVKLKMIDNVTSDKTLTYADGKLSDPQKELFSPSTPVQEVQVLNWCASWCGSDDSSEALVEYIERSWDGMKVVDKEVTKTAFCLNEIDVSKKQFLRKEGYWYVTDNLIIEESLYVSDGKELNIILCDDATLTLKAINISGKSTLRIFGQKEGTGQLIITDPGEGHCAIGAYAEGGAKIEIHGGIITAKGGEMCAAIGESCMGDDISHQTCYFNDIKIYGGVINATGGDGAAGIGGGLYSKNWGNVSIYGGDIHAQGGGYVPSYGYYGGAGIGGGYGGPIASVNIYDGNIHATGGSEAAGIGCGESAEGAEYNGKGIVNVYGGNVEARGADHAAGIGGGDGAYLGIIYISGGNVNAFGGVNAAGIGGGQGAEGHQIEIRGGAVYAYAGADGAGIGGGADGDGGEIYISGGKVYAYGKTDSNDGYGAGIGGGQDGNSGKITIEGGEVYAYGGDDAAGIGTGEETTSGSNIKADNITIRGGHVEALGQGYGAGIGAGQDAEVGTITVSTQSGNLFIDAWAGDDCGVWAGSIGAYKEDYFGTLNIGNRVKVIAWIDPIQDVWGEVAVSDDPVAYVQQRQHVQLRTCDHPGYTPETCIYCTH